MKNTNHLKNFLILFVLSLGLITIAKGMTINKLSDEELEEIKSLPNKLYFNQIALRIVFNGNKAMYKAAFKIAFENKDYIKQIALANAFYASFCLRESDIDKKRILSLNINNWKTLYLAVFPSKQKNKISKKLDRVCNHIYVKAKKKGYFPAYFALEAKVNPKLFTHPLKEKISSFKSFAEDENQEAMFYYGQALTLNSEISSENFLTGLRFMIKSGFLIVKFNYKDISSVQRSEPSKTYKNCVFHCSQYVFAPNEEFWKNLKLSLI
jgi:hypothetical protein